MNRIVQERDCCNGKTARNKRKQGTRRKINYHVRAFYVYLGISTTSHSQGFLSLNSGYLLKMSDSAFVRSSDEDLMEEEEPVTDIDVSTKCTFLPYLVLRACL